MQLTITLPKINKRNLAIGIVALGASIGGYVAWSQYQETQQIAQCSEARDMRKQASTLLVKTIFSGYADLAVDGADALERANELVRECNAKGY